MENISNTKLPPSKIKDRITQDLFDRLKKSWQHAKEIETHIRIDTLVRVILGLSQDQMNTFLEKYRRRFVPKY